MIKLLVYVLGLLTLLLIATPLMELTEDLSKGRLTFSVRYSVAPAPNGTLLVNITLTIDALNASTDLRHLSVELYKDGTLVAKAESAGVRGRVLELPLSFTTTSVHELLDLTIKFEALVNGVYEIEVTVPVERVLKVGSRYQTLP